MILARVRFESEKNLSRESVEVAVEFYLTGLLQHGHIIDDYLYAWKDGVLTAYTYLAAADALDLDSYSDIGKGHLSNVRETLGRRPEWTILEDDYPRRTPRWQTAPFLVLYADALRVAPPVRRGRDGKPIPTYRLPPLAWSEHPALFHWQRDYQHHDHVWLHTGTLEMQAYRELADPDSALSENGRWICGQIEEATGKPTYYYLYRHYGRKKGEEKRKCPGCGSEWRTDMPGSICFDLGKFHFQCVKCRLVSHLASSDEDERHARIGEYRKRKKNR